MRGEFNPPLPPLEDGGGGGVCPLAGPAAQDPRREAQRGRGRVHHYKVIYNFFAYIFFYIVKLNKLKRIKSKYKLFEYYISILYL